VITWLTLRCRARSQKRGNRGVSSEAFGQLQCPVLKCMGYEASVIGGGQGWIRREQEESTDAEIMTVSL